MYICIYHLVPINRVIMFDRVDFGHREGNSKPDYGYRKGLHSTFLEDFNVGRNGRFISAKYIVYSYDLNRVDHCSVHLKIRNRGKYYTLQLSDSCGY